jgi:hypothetical protein
MSTQAGVMAMNTVPTSRALKLEELVILSALRNIINGYKQLTTNH